MKGAPSNPGGLPLLSSPPPPPPSLDLLAGAASFGPDNPLSPAGPGQRISSSSGSAGRPPRSPASVPTLAGGM